MRRWTIVAALLGVTTSTPALAQDAAATATFAPAEEMQVAVRQAQDLGEQLYRYDQAAWHATDTFLEKFDRAKQGMMRGYIVLPGEGQSLDAVFYGERDGALVEVARYNVAGSKVTGGDFLPIEKQVPLSGLAIRMASARAAALAEAGERKVALCADESPNTIVLPPDAQDRVAVYLMTPPVANDRYPLGGHHRFYIDAASKVTDYRKFTNSCIDLQTKGPKRGDLPVMAYFTHLLDPQPTEIHFLATRFLPMPMTLMTVTNKLAWQIRSGSLISVQRMPDQAPAN